MAETPTSSWAATYWDSSAIVSALFPDSHTDEAQAEVRKSNVHLMSSRAWVETLAILARTEREGAMPADRIEAAYEVLAGRVWRRVDVLPRWEGIRGLARTWALKGADLWHLAAAKGLREEVPGLRLLSFDRRLQAAARGEGLA